MKYLKISIFVACLIIYIYSAYMTSVEPNNVLWGYICTIFFLLITIIAIKQYSKKVVNDKK